MKLNKKLANAALIGLLATGGLAACATEGGKGKNGCGENGCGENGCKGKAKENGCEGKNSCGENGCNH